MSPESYIPPFPWDLDVLPYVTLEDHEALPATRGIYFFRTSQEVLYIGATINLSARLAHHNRLEPIREVVVPVFIAWLPCPHAGKLLLLSLEKQAVAHYQPLMNCGPGKWLDHDRWPSTKGPYGERSIQRFRAILAHLMHITEEPATNTVGTGKDEQILETAAQPRIAAKLREARTAQGLSQAMLAAMLGISQQAYSHYETGRTVIPTQHLTRLCNALPLDRDALLRLWEDEED
jgi:DNA-binding XRE family transcriptional regulator